MKFAFEIIINNCIILLMMYINKAKKLMLYYYCVLYRGVKMKKNTKDLFMRIFIDVIVILFIAYLCFGLLLIVMSFI
jgi:hypothetical protein